MPETRLNIQRLATALLLGVILPICLALILDLALNTLPIATIVAIVICMPLGAIWLNRVSLHELDRVLNVVAPEETIATQSDEPGLKAEDGIVATADEPADNSGR